MCGVAEGALAVNAIGAAISAGAAYQQGQNQQAWGNYNAQVANNNAVYAQQLGKYKEDRQREADRYKRSKMEVLFMKAGVQLDETSSAALVMDEQAVQDEMEALMIRNGAQVEANRFRSQAVLDRMQGYKAAQQGMLGAGATLLTSAGSIGMQGYRAGVWGSSGTTKSGGE
jgi:hypothetical protein